MTRIHRPVESANRELGQDATQSKSISARTKNLDDGGLRFDECDKAELAFATVVIAVKLARAQPAMPCQQQADELVGR